MIELSIATGQSRKTKVWQNKVITWNKLVKKLSDPVTTGESYKEYISLGATKEGRERQAEIKDRGGFVGGHLKDGKRSPRAVEFRTVLALDIDAGEKSFWGDFTMFFGCAAVLHSTHKHSDKAPRYRLIVPLDRKVSKEQYEAIARQIAGYFNINIFDPTTFQPERLMYWPTIAKDGDWLFEYQKGEALNADGVLASYEDWSDITTWPKHEEETVRITTALKQQGSPEEKPGLIGAFNRKYNIHEAISEFLPDVFEQTAFEERYTFIEGTAAAGAIVYGDAEFLFSHHSTDPGHNLLLNSFDLVRVHKFGHEDSDPDQEITKKRSYRLMNDFAKEMPEVVKELGVARMSAFDDFNDGFECEEDKDWLGELSLDKYQKYEITTPNFETIIANDPNLRGLKYDEFNLRPVATKPLPWNVFDGERQWLDADDSGLRNYIEKRYGIYNTTKCKDALSLVFKRNAFHPIRNYLDGIVWDGIERLDWLLVDYLGAEDTAFVRLATRKAFTAAVARVYQPGIKFDYVLTLIGKEGIKKSTLLDKMGGKWFSDSFAGVEGNKAFEQLQGAWLIEMGELSGVKRSEAEAVKHFITKRTDRFRVAYGVRIEDFPRQCVFFASTNEKAFLRDNNGNRRFWPVTVTDYGEKDMDSVPVDQLWAEAKQYYKFGEKLYFDADVEEDARELQRQHTESDDRTGIIEHYLEVRLPFRWDKMKLHERLAYLQDDDTIFDEGDFKRRAVCVAEIWCEVLKGVFKDMNTHNTKFLHAILEKIPGWEKAPGNLRFPIYGKQRAYVPSHTLKREIKKKSNRQTK